MTAAQSQRGRTREVDVVKFLTEQGWSAIRAASGPVDVVARGRSRPEALAVLHRNRVAPVTLYIQVKSTSGGPYERFGPAERAAFLAAAARAGADAWLVHWPPHGKLRWIPASQWPSSKSVANGRSSVHATPS